MKKLLLGLLLSLSISSAWAQNPQCPTRPFGDNTNACASTAFVQNALVGLFANPTAQVGLTAINGSATTAIRSDAAPALSQSITPTWTGKHIFNNSTYAAAFGGPVTIAPGSSSISSSNRALSISQGGTGSSLSEIYYNNISISDAAVITFPAQRSIGLRVSVNPNAGAVGQRIGILGEVSLTDTGVTLFNDMIGGEFVAYANKTNGGTAPDLHGTLFGCSCVGIADAGALYYQIVTGGEATAIIKTGASANIRFGWTIAANGDIPATTYDAGLGFYSYSAAGKFRNAILLTSVLTDAPLRTDGCVLCTDGAAETIAKGIDLSSYTITDTFLKGPGGFTVDGAGAVVVANTTSTSGFSTGAVRIFGGLSVQNQGSAATGLYVNNAILTTGPASGFTLSRRDTNAVVWQINSIAGNFEIYDAIGTTDRFVMTAAGALTLSNYGLGLLHSSAGGVITSSLVANADLANMATNTVKGNATSGSAAPTDLSMTSCSSASSAVIWTTNTGFGCNTSITAAAVPASGLTGSTLAAGVTASSLTSVGTLTSGSINWTGTITTTVGIAAFSYNASVTQNSLYNAFQITNNSTGTAALLAINIANSAGGGIFGIGGVNYTGLNSQATNKVLVYGNSSTAGIAIVTDAALPITFVNGVTPTERWRIQTSGELVGTIATDATSTATGAIQNPGGMSVNKRVWMNGLTTTTASQTAYVCQASTGELVADTSAVNLCVASSREFKRDIEPLADGLDEIMRLRPVSYRYKPEGLFRNDRRIVGLIAEDVAEVDERIVGFANGKPHSVQYEFLTAVLAKAIQELKADNDNLRSEIEQLKQRVIR